MGEMPIYCLLSTRETTSIVSCLVGKMKVMDLVHLEENMKELRECFRSRKTKSATWRRDQLEGLMSLLKEKESEIFKALKEDLGKPRAEAYRDEVGPEELHQNLLHISFSFTLFHGLFILPSSASDSAGWSSEEISESSFELFG